MIRRFLSLYWWRYPQVLVYMLQSNEYQVLPYLAWYWRTTDFSEVTHRRSLDYTRAARLLLLALRLGMLLQIGIGLSLIVWWYWYGLEGGWQFGLALILAYPLVWAHLVAVPLGLGRLLIVGPRERRLIRQSERIFRNHPGARLAILGSYGKTSMKELLLTVLSEGKKVAATPANKNVAISHAHFAATLNGDEDVLLIEYGEGGPGDIARFAKATLPTHAVMTGVTAAHLDRYGTIDRAAQDIFSIDRFVEASKIYANSESSLAQPYLKGKKYVIYNQQGVLGWKVGAVRIGIEGTSFTLTKGQRSLKLHSKLLGRHQVGPLAFAAALAVDEFGMTNQQVKAGVAKTEPFEHRMQPYRLGGAWIIDDTYNGNLEGIRAGTTLLKELEAQRKIYVTPGLVDQGSETERVHEEMGRLIAAAHPDLVVLMRNSATPYITKGLQAAGYNKRLIVQNDPLDFYLNLQSFVAAGDIALMQNDWTDNYS